MKKFSLFLLLFFLLIIFFILSPAAYAQAAQISGNFVVEGPPEDAGDDEAAADALADSGNGAESSGLGTITGAVTGPQEEGSQEPGLIGRIFIRIALFFKSLF